MELHTLEEGECERIQRVLEKHQDGVRITIIEMHNLLQAFPFDHRTAVVLGLLASVGSTKAWILTMSFIRFVVRLVNRGLSRSSSRL